MLIREKRDDITIVTCQNITRKRNMKKLVSPKSTKQVLKILEQTTSSKTFKQLALQ